MLKDVFYKYKDTDKAFIEIPWLNACLDPKVSYA